MLLADVLNVLEELAPLRYAEGWDNVGLLVGDPRVVIAKVLVTVDYTAAVADEAVANDHLGDACGMHAIERRPLRPYAGEAGRAELEGIGLGRIGATSLTRASLVAQLKAQLGLSHLLVAGPVDGPPGTVAVAAGAGGVFVTGEVRHHEALGAARRGVTVIATLHSNSERAAVRAYAGRLAARLPGVTVAASTQDRDPFTVL